MFDGAGHAFEDSVFSEDFKHVIEGWTDGDAGDGEATGVNKGSGFDAFFSGQFLQLFFAILRCECGKRGVAVLQFHEQV